MCCSPFERDSEVCSVDREDEDSWGDIDKYLNKEHRVEVPTSSSCYADQDGWDSLDETSYRNGQLDVGNISESCHSPSKGHAHIGIAQELANSNMAPHPVLPFRVAGVDSVANEGYQDVLSHSP